MNEPWEDLEAKMRAMRLKAVSAGLEERILCRLTPSSATPAQPIESTEVAKTHSPPRRRSMFYLATRGLAGAAAAAALLVTWWVMSGQPGDSSAAFAEVLKKTAAADTLELQVTRDGKPSTAWLRGGKELRWNLPDGTYQIAREGKLWLIDEKANRAAAQPSTYFGEQPGQELLALLSVAPQKELLAAKPAERAERNGHKCDIYRWEMPEEKGKLRVEAEVDVDSRLLQSLEAVREVKGRLEPLGKVTVVACNKPVAEELFVVGDTLTEDGRIGKVTDVPGHGRHPAGDGPALEPGGRADARSAWATGSGPIRAGPTPSRSAWSSRPRWCSGPGTLGRAGPRRSRSASPTAK